MVRNEWAELALWYGTNGQSLLYGTERMGRSCSMVRNEWADLALWYRTNGQILLYGTERMGRSCSMVRNEWADLALWHGTNGQSLLHVSNMSAELTERWSGDDVIMDVLSAGVHQLA